MRISGMHARHESITCRQRQSRSHRIDSDRRHQSATSPLATGARTNAGVGVEWQSFEHRSGPRSLIESARWPDESWSQPIRTVAGTRSSVGPLQGDIAKLRELIQKSPQLFLEADSHQDNLLGVAARGGHGEALEDRTNAMRSRLFGRQPSLHRARLRLCVQSCFVRELRCAP